MFGQEKVFSRLVADLKDLEDSGFQLQDGSNLKASLIAICGDNLGSHVVGGFTENFSPSKHFCRYCLIDRKTFVKSPLAFGPQRTTENSNDSVQQLTPDQNVIDGIKSDSCFNSLKSFHICSGLPPCLGHDLFEGVVANDLALYIEHLVKAEKHFTYDQINRAISQTKLLGSDMHNKPCETKEKPKKLSGSATQNWCLLWLFSLYVSRWIKHSMESEVWQLCPKVREIAELICAPKIHQNEVAYLKVFLEEYVSSRKSMFPDYPLRPKHHYMLHYPDLILKFGPLIRLWTLRFESKHCYFRDCARKLHYFIHLSKTLAERHQFLQSYLGQGHLFPAHIQIAGEVNEIDERSYNRDIQMVLNTSDIDKQKTSEVSAVTYKGTKYTKGLVVALEHTGETLVFGKISLILSDERNVFVVLVHRSVLVI